MNMEQKRQKRYVLSFAILMGLLLLFFLLNVGIGSVSLPVGDIIKALFAKNRESMIYRIVWDIRLPRTIAVIVLGGALAISGFLLQTYFHNPIAGPFVLGIASGAKLAVALVMIVFLGHNLVISSLWMMVAAFVGSLLSMGFVLAVAKRVGNMSMLVVCGVMVSYICSAITDFLVTFAEDTNIVNLHNWSLGSFSGTSWSHVQTMSLVVFLTVAACILASKPIGAYQMGEAYARNMGVNIRRFRILLILLSSILSACVTAFAGPISFVGIAVPHLVKFLFKTAKPLLMIPACFLGGAVFCLFSDLLARILFAPTELSISSVTAVFGAPIVIYMMLHQRKRTIS